LRQEAAGAALANVGSNPGVGLRYRGKGGGARTAQPGGGEAHPGHGALHRTRLVPRQRHGRAQRRLCDRRRRRRPQRGPEGGREMPPHSCCHHLTFGGQGGRLLLGAQRNFGGCTRRTGHAGWTRPCRLAGGESASCCTGACGRRGGRGAGQACGSGSSAAAPDASSTQAALFLPEQGESERCWVAALGHPGACRGRRTGW